MSEILKTNVVVADLDLAFGTTGLDFNQDPIQGIAEALQNPERLDEVLLDRLLTKCSERLSIFAAPVVLDRDYDISVEGCAQVIDVVRQNVPYVIVDLPHTWTAWVKHTLLQADEVIITAAPDLANLRNAKNIVDLLQQVRRNDSIVTCDSRGIGNRDPIQVDRLLSSHIARSTPRRPPAIDSISDSQPSCVSSRVVFAPTADRIANSRRRDDARVSIRLPMLPHAINSTAPTAPNSASTARRTSPTSCSRSCTRLTVHPVLKWGQSRTSDAITPSISAWA
jgi:cellulose biosynthesis protein BcsQ